MSKFVNLHCHSHFSLLDGLSQPSQIAKRCNELGYEACAISDHGNIFASIDFYDSMTKAGVKPIQGSEFYIAKEDATVKEKTNTNSHLVVLAKNERGWKQLIRATSEANKKEFFYKKPRLDLDRLGSFADGNLISFSGHMGSALADCLFVDVKLAYNADTYEKAKVLVRKDWEVVGTQLINKYKDIFGPENFFIEIQRIDIDNLPAADVVSRILRYLAKKTNTPCVATADSHYCRRQDAQDQWVILCNNMGVTLAEVRKGLENGDDVGLGGFFKSNSYHIPSVEEMEAIHTPEELENSLRIAAMCEPYKLTGKPIMPVFDCPNGMNADDYMKQLCREGWKKKIVPNVPKERIAEYTERVKKELRVIQGAGLSGYFLVVQDYMNAARQRGEMVGIRGSGGGCMLSYLLDIMDVDPIPPELIFERFYNEGRNTPDHISLPDIDADFEDRNATKAYCQQKYGKDCVSEILTFGRMMGRSALKDVLRVHGACDEKTANKITEFIPDENEINDQLEEMSKTGDAKIVLWALQNNSKQLSEYCRLEDDGKLSGPYARYFEQAIRLEGTKRSRGKHPAGMVIAPHPIPDMAPVIYDGDDMILAYDMRDAEKFGFVKFDVLNVSALKKMHDVLDSMADGNL